MDSEENIKYIDKYPICPEIDRHFRFGPLRVLTAAVWVMVGLFFGTLWGIYAHAHGIFR